VDFYFFSSYLKIKGREIIFSRLGPYLMGSKGMFLSHWTLDFDANIEILVSPVWVRLSFIEEEARPIHKI
jgi:hypothetical protein